MTDVCHLLVVSTIAFTLTPHYVWAPSVSMPRISILLYTPSRVINLVSKKSNKLAKAEGNGVHFVVCVRVCVCVYGFFLVITLLHKNTAIIVLLCTSFLLIRQHNPH